MPRLFGAKAGSTDAPSSTDSVGRRTLDALYEQELQTNLAALQENRRKNRRHRSLRDWTDSWPLAAGIVLSVFTPQLHHLIEPYRPWGQWIVFPFAAFLNRPEMNLKGDAAYTLPLAFMYLQFPIEGLLARVGLRGRVTLPRCLGLVLLLHACALLELWLANGRFGR